MSTTVSAQAARPPGSQPGALSEQLQTSGLLLGSGAAGDTAFQVELPPGLPTEHVVSEYALSGEGLSVRYLRIEPGVHQYTIPVGAGETLELFAHCPGYRIAHASNPPLDQPWKPEFVKLNTTPLKGRLTGTAGEPLRDRKVALWYSLEEMMSFFGCIDGSVPVLLIATAQTKEDGSFEIAVPQIETDPFLREQASNREVWGDREGNREFRIGLGEALLTGRESWALQPDTIPVRSEYSSPLALKVVEKAHLHGRIGRSFLARQGVTGTVSHSLSRHPGDNTAWIRLSAASRKGSRTHYRNCMLESDLSFSVALPPGEYRLVLHESKGQPCTTREVVVRETILLGEGEDRQIMVE